MARSCGLYLSNEFSRTLSEALGGRPADPQGVWWLNLLMRLWQVHPASCAGPQWYQRLTPGGQVKPASGNKVAAGVGLTRDELRGVLTCEELSRSCRCFENDLLGFCEELRLREAGLDGAKVAQTGS